MCASVIIPGLFWLLAVPLDGDHPACTIHLHLLWQDTLIIVNRHLVEDIYDVHGLGLCEEGSRWYLEMQGVQEDYRRWCSDGVGNGGYYCSQVSLDASSFGSTQQCLFTVRFVVCGNLRRLRTNEIDVG